LLAAVSLGAATNDTSLAASAKRADTAAVRALLSKHVDVNAPGPDGSTALYWAVYQNDAEMVDLLLRAGANATIGNQYGATPLLVACTNGNAAIVERLLKAGADPNARSIGETAFMTAARTGSLEVAKVLLTHGADVAARDQVHGQTALMVAAAEKHPAMVQFLIENRVDVNARSKGGFSALLFAVRAGDLASVRSLVAAGEKPTEVLPDGTSALMMAILNGNYELGTFLLDNGADPNVDNSGRTALHALIQVRNWEGLANAPVVTTGNVDSTEMLNALLNHGANPNARMTKELPFAHYRGASQTSAVGVTGSTPFWWAARGADLEAMRILLAKGADPLLATTENTTPLMVAAGVGYVDGQTPGSERDALEAVKLILERKADINAANQCDPGSLEDVNRSALAGEFRGRGYLCGWTALHGAASRGADSVVAFLVERGANPKAKENFGRTPLNLAQGHVVWVSVYIRESTVQLLQKLAGDAAP
jgi:ankyrin repeat protein